MQARPLQILFLTHYFPPEGNAPATRVLALARRWVSQGCRVTVVTGVPNVPDGRIYDGYRNKLWQVEEISGIKVVRVWTLVAANQGMGKRVANYLSFMAAATIAGCALKKPDVVMATSPQFFCGWTGALLGKLRGRPFILEVRDLWPESIVAVGALRQRWLIAALEWLEKRLYALADYIVTVGEGYRQKLQEHSVPSVKLGVAMNGIDRAGCSASDAGLEIRKRYGLEGKFVCSYIGTVGLACGLEVVLRAAAALRTRGDREVVFLIVGAGATQAQLKEAARKQELENVIFTGLQPKNLMTEFLAASNVCLVHLKKQELFRSVMPSKIFEALAMSRPIILGVEGAAADFLRVSASGLCVEPENPQALLQAIERLQRDPALAQCLGRNGRDYVLKHLDWDTLAENYLQQIHRVLESVRS